MNILRALLRQTLGKRLPITSGELDVEGLQSSVKISRDRYGIPMIEASNEADAIFALGFCHGQDRAGQLEVLLRLGRGTIAEMTGPKALPVDRIARRVGFRHAAKEQWPLIGETNQRLLMAYTNGINAGYSHGLRHRPHEFVALRIRPTPWEPADVLAYTKIQSWFMASNWDVELARMRILLADGPEALKALDPASCMVGESFTEPTSSEVGSAKLPPTMQAIDRLAEDIAAFEEIMPRGGGSNNWVIAPSRTTTGRPILCNDPHLAAQIPAPWYLVSIRTPDWAVAGASFVGSPAVPCGHNGHAAWGVTAGLTDNTDLFLEELRRDGDQWQYRQGDHWLPCGVRREEIRIRGSASVVEEVLSTSRGPIINPVLHDTPEALSLRAIWLDPLPLDGWLSAMKAKNFEEFRAPFRKWPGFPMNLVYADVSGKTAWQLVGQLPVRKRGHGLLPLAGWDDRNGWHEELVPFEQMPVVEDPVEGFFATANNLPPQRDGGPFVGVDFLDHYRHQVIVEELASREKWDLAGAASIQLNVKSIPWREVRDAVLADDFDQTAMLPRQMLRKWDSEVSADSYPAALFEVFMATMACKVAQAKVPNAWKWVVGNGPSILNPFSFFGYRQFAHLAGLINRKPDGWLEKGWVKTMSESLSEAFRITQGVFEKGWGTLRPLTLQHFVLGRTPLRKAFDVGPIPISGDEHTPNHASAMPLDPLGPVKSMPNLRATIDVGEWSNSRFILAGGQSGNLFSPHYKDMLPLWQRGEGVPIAFTSEEVKRATVAELTLRPN